MAKLKIIIFIAYLLCFAGCSADIEPFPDGPVIPVHLAGIEAVNIDNAGPRPLSTVEPVKKEAYMIGVRWVTDNSDPDGDQSITGPVFAGTGLYRNVTDGYTKRIFSNTDFNSNNPAGANISQYFKAITYLPPGIDEGFVLLFAPEPGEHSFKVVYTNSTGDRYEYDTELIKLY